MSVDLCGWGESVGRWVFVAASDPRFGFMLGSAICQSVWPNERAWSKSAMLHGTTPNCCFVTTVLWDFPSSF